MPALFKRLWVALLLACASLTAASPLVAANRVGERKLASLATSRRLLEAARSRSKQPPLMQKPQRRQRRRYQLTRAARSPIPPCPSCWRAWHLLGSVLSSSRPSPWAPTQQARKLPRQRLRHRLTPLAGMHASTCTGLARPPTAHAAAAYLLHHALMQSCAWLPSLQPRSCWCCPSPLC